MGWGGVGRAPTGSPTQPCGGAEQGAAPDRAAGAAAAVARGVQSPTVSSANEACAAPEGRGENEAGRELGGARMRRGENEAGRAGPEGSCGGAGGGMLGGGVRC